MTAVTLSCRPATSPPAAAPAAHSVWRRQGTRLPASAAAPAACPTRQGLLQAWARRASPSSSATRSIRSTRRAPGQAFSGTAWAQPSSARCPLQARRRRQPRPAPLPARRRPAAAAARFRPLRRQRRCASGSQEAAAVLAEAAAGARGRPLAAATAAAGWILARYAPCGCPASSRPPLPACPTGPPPRAAATAAPRARTSAAAATAPRASRTGRPRPAARREACAAAAAAAGRRRAGLPCAWRPRHRAGQAAGRRRPRVCSGILRIPNLFSVRRLEGARQAHALPRPSPPHLCASIFSPLQCTSLHVPASSGWESAAHSSLQHATPPLTVSR